MTQLLTAKPASPEVVLRDGAAGSSSERRRLSALEARAERLADAESELDRLGEEIDLLRGRGEAIPQRLREELREAGRRRLGLRWAE